MADPAYVKVQDPFKSSKNSKTKEFSFREPWFSNSKNLA
jgi:hypothetical protein